MSRLFHRITAMSVKESFDNLPTGIMFAEASGRILMSNRRMDEIVQGLTGSRIYDAASFYDMIAEGSYTSLPDGRVVEFLRYDFTDGGVPCFELDAYDITEEHALTVELMEREDQARIGGARLRGISERIKELTMEQETLSARSRIHDMLGHCLLMSRRYLSESHEDIHIVDRDELISSWRLVVSLLSRDGMEPWEAPYYSVTEQARALGIELVVDGELPEDGAAARLAESAISVELNNALRHAGASTVRAKVERTFSYIRISLTNDGRTPDAPVTEGGGLSGLRRMAESMGGSMSIDCHPAFLLTITVPV